jgi:hypothetical protein
MSDQNRITCSEKINYKNNGSFLDLFVIIVFKTSHFLEHEMKAF